MIYDKEGRRKYLTNKELKGFVEVARCLPHDRKSFCLTLAYSGARLSEALSLTADHVDLDAGVIVFESLKKRQRGVYRAIPLPHELMLEVLEAASKPKVGNTSKRRSQYIWPWGRTTAWAIVKDVMRSAELPADLTMPKALRHAFAVGAIQAGVPLNVLQKWMGHSRLTTTAIYTNVVGAEEHAFAQKLWDGWGHK